MASVQASYNGGAGYIGYVGGAKTARFKFTTGPGGATSLSFRTKNFDNDLANDASTWATAGNFRFAISASPTAYYGYYGTAGKACAAQTGTALSGSISQNLLPNTTYYLFLFPSSSGYYDWYINGLTGNAVTLSGTYAQASTVSAENGEFGQPIQIRLNRALETVSHRVSVSCAGQSTTLLESTDSFPEDGVLDWTPAVSAYAPQITDAAGAEATITVETFNGAVSYGTSSTTIRVSFREADVAPQLSDGWAAVAAYNGESGDPACGLSGFIQGYSRAEVSFDAAKIGLRYGAALAGYTLEALGEKVSAAPYRSGVLAEGTTVICSVTDSRGFRSAASFEISLLPYKAPTISGSVSRVNSDPNGEPEDGTGISIQARAQAAALNGQNTLSVRYWIRRIGEAYSGNGTELGLLPATLVQPGTWSVETAQVTAANKSPDTSYEIKIQVTDALGNSAAVLSKLPTRQWAMKFRADGQGVAFGKAPEHSAALELPDTWQIYFGNSFWLERVYPVGCLYFSIDPRDPHDLFGGTWARIYDSFILAAGNNYPVGGVGGAASHSFNSDAQAAIGMYKSGSSAYIEIDDSGDGGVTQGADRAFTGYTKYASLSGYSDTASDSYVTPSAAKVTGSVNTMPPYFTVYIWQRTA